MQVCTTALPPSPPSSLLSLSTLFYGYIFHNNLPLSLSTLPASFLTHLLIHRRRRQSAPSSSAATNTQIPVDRDLLFKLGQPVATTKTHCTVDNVTSQTFSVQVCGGTKTAAHNPVPSLKEQQLIRAPGNYYLPYTYRTTTVY